MAEGYQKRDHEIIDYGLFHLEGIHRGIRGPEPASLEPGGYFTAIGAAQTFGCYSERPYPVLLQEALALPSLNLGVAGAGPSFFVKRPRFIHYVNQGRFAIVQIMSGRSESNRLFESRDGGEWLTRRTDGQELGAEPAYREALQALSRREMKSLIHETRQSWILNYRALLSQIEVPVILFWFSVRRPRYWRRFRSVQSLFGKFPQFVDRSWLDGIRQEDACYVECVSSRGMPQKLVSRFTGEPVSIDMRQDLGGRSKGVNDYYPSPEMHEDAARALSGPARKLV